MKLLSLSFPFFLFISTLGGAVKAPILADDVVQAELIIVGTLKQEEDADDVHQGMVIVDEVLLGKAKKGQKIPVTWSKKPTDLPKGLEHTADYVFAPIIGKSFIFILQPKSNTHFLLDHGSQVEMDQLNEVKALVKAGVDLDFVGKSEEAAGALGKARGIAVRVVERDGESYFVTADYRTDRLNLTIEKGKVVRVRRG